LNRTIRAKIPAKPRILATTVGSYPVPDWLAALPPDGELDRFDMNHPDTNEMIEYVIRPMAGISSVVGRSGNYGGRTIPKGNWRKLAAFLNAMHCDHLVLELAHRSAAGLDALKHVGRKIARGPGVIDIKVNCIETPDPVAGRIAAAEKVVGTGCVRWVPSDGGCWMRKRSITDRKNEALVKGRDLYLGR